ncbi:MAG: hypothetical protein NC342_07675 [Pseudoflavonifractor sp.]|nr:3-phosphoshikimate 1-carboxyvinyltransferase [Alloprevotella sp.]MCM1117399.1 hypothetical protein [Pseudoflavonifractor sp.]
MDIQIFPPDGILETRVELPLSKSISNRALIINALTPAAAPLEAVAVCDDTEAVARALSAPEATEVNVGAAGTAMRFLTAYYAATPGAGPVTLDGSERMRCRPIGPLVDALRALGASIDYLDREGYPPLKIGRRKISGGEVSIPASVSSQYISALMMVGPVMEQGLRLTLEGEPASLPYIKMTLGMMAMRGADASMEGNVVTIKAGAYNPSLSLPVEADWSAAAFWYEIVALTAGWVTLAGRLSVKSLQGDAEAERLFGRLGVTSSTDEVEDGDIELSGNPDADARLDADLRHTPDLTQPLVVTCALLGIPFTLTGLDSLRIKETDRAEALRVELLKLGVRMEISQDILHGLTLSWDGSRRPIVEAPVFDTYDDHRMAMAFAPAAVYLPGTVIRRAEVVAKSYPRFWDHLAAAGFEIKEV